MAQSSKLFSPLQLGDVKLNHRVAMAPLTRFRCDENHLPLPFVKTYYEQRAAVPGTLIITEATLISPRADGGDGVPMIHTPEQVKAWKEIVDAVHAQGSFIYCQLWAMGRAAAQGTVKARGIKTVSSSAARLPPDFTGEHDVPHVLSEEEIQEFIGDYASAAKNAISAGFDGVEIHGANGYLVDQFTQDTVNTRTDRWGGSIENRSRFAIEVAKAVSSAVGAHRTGIRLSPFSDFQGMYMKDPQSQFSHLVTELKTLKLGHLHLIESRISGVVDKEKDGGEKIDFLADIWGKTSPLLLAGGFTANSGLEVVEEYPRNDVIVVFGRHFIANPDLPFRIKEGIPLTKYDRNTFYNFGETRGYIDWPFSKEFEASPAGAGIKSKA